MSLQVNLLIPSEQRSAAPVNLKLMIRLAYLAVPAALLLFGLAGVVDLMTLKSELNRLERKWGKNAEGVWVVDEPDRHRTLFRGLEMAQQEQGVIKRNDDILKELRGWKNSRMHWHVALSNICAEVPPSTQILNLMISQKMQLPDQRTKQVRARLFELTLKGKAKGRTAKQDIETLSDRLAGLESVASASIPSFDVDSSQGANQDEDRVFTIKCSFVPREFK